MNLAEKYITSHYPISRIVGLIIFNLSPFFDFLRLLKLATRLSFMIALVNISMGFINKIIVTFFSIAWFSSAFWLHIRPQYQVSLWIFQARCFFIDSVWKYVFFLLKGFKWWECVRVYIICCSSSWMVLVLQVKWLNNGKVCLRFLLYFIHNTWPNNVLQYLCQSTK